ncbi:MAG TPA: hypothetical protein VFD03_00115 [Clostridia bacterium]|nr:hypothetical protein [Clostridia bacterium]
MKSKIKRFTPLIMAFIILFTVVGCTNNNSISSSAEFINFDKAEVLDYSTVKSLREDFLIKEYQPQIPEKFELGCIAAYDSKIYYTQFKPIKMAEMNMATNIVMHDLQTGENKTIFHIENSGAHYINELYATGTSLFWVLTINNETRIEKYDLATQKITHVKIFEDGAVTILLSSDERYLSWFEANKENKRSLFVYDTINDQIELISSTIARQSPYTRAHINDGIIAFVTSSGEYNTLNVYDLQHKEYRAKLDFDKETEFANPIANDKFVIWCAGQLLGSNIDLYAYDLVNKTTIKINDSSDSDLMVFSFDIIDSTLLINDYKSKQIIGYDIAKKNKSELTSDLSGTHSYLLAAATADHNFLTYDLNKQQILLLKKNPDKI